MNDITLNIRDAMMLFIEYPEGTNIRKFSMREFYYSGRLKEYIDFCDPSGNILRTIKLIPEINRTPDNE